MSGTPRVGPMTIMIDGRAYTVAELVSRVRELTPLTRDDVRAIVREELSAIEQTEHQRVEAAARDFLTSRGFPVDDGESALAASRRWLQLRVGKLLDEDVRKRHVRVESPEVGALLDHLDEFMNAFSLQLDRLLSIVEHELERDRRCDPHSVDYDLSGSFVAADGHPESSPLREGLRRYRTEVGGKLRVDVQASTRVDDRGHESSPSADGCGDHSVGDGHVAGAAQSAPATVADGGAA